MNQFSLSLTDWSKQAEAKAEKVLKAALIDIVARIDMRSPVGNKELWADNLERMSKGLPALPKGYVGGRFRGNWQFGVGEVPKGVLKTVDPSGSGTVANAIGKIPVKPLGNVFFYTNNLPYAERLENGWSYKQAPEGMVGITVLEWSQIIESSASKL